MSGVSRFVVASLLIVGLLVWLGISGVQESKTYYLTIPELLAQTEPAPAKVRVAGDVVAGSVRREGRRVRFQLRQDEHRLEVVYEGSEPLPDTFVDDAQAVVTGRYSSEHVFHARQVQAKCASKYEALPPGGVAAGRRTSP